MNLLKKKIVYIPLSVILLLILIGTLPKLAGLIMVLATAGGGVYLYRKSNKFNQFNKGLKVLITAGLFFAFILGIGFINYNPQLVKHKNLAAEKLKLEEKELNEKSKKEEEERIVKEETNKKLEEEKKQLEAERIAKEETDKKLEEEQLKKEEQEKKDIAEKAIAEAEEEKKIEENKKTEENKRKVEAENAKAVASKANKGNNTSNTSNNSSAGGEVTTNEPAKGEGIVYWVSGGKSYHSRENCRSLARSKNILSGPGSSCPKTDPCNNCVR